jgi:nucleoside-diphosphate-sugar epimerase
MARILIVGCGYVGTHLAKLLTQSPKQSHQVFAVSRTARALPPNVVPILTDISQTNSQEIFPQDIDFAVFCAAAKQSSPEVYRAVYVDGLRNTIEQLKRNSKNLSRLLFTSSTSVYAQNHGEWVDESSETVPQGFSGTLMLEAESLLQNQPVATSSVRLGGIYGPERTSFVTRVRDGLTSLPACAHYRNRIHVEDCAGVLKHLLMGVETLAPIYLGVDNNPADLRDVIRFLSKHLQTEIPEPIADSVPAHQEQGKRCRNDLVRQSGYQFRFSDYRDGYLPILQSLSSGLH